MGSLKTLANYQMNLHSREHESWDIFGSFLVQKTSYCQKETQLNSQCAVKISFELRKSKILRSLLCCDSGSIFYKYRRYFEVTKAIDLKTHKDQIKKKNFFIVFRQ
jgi:hypothetical protein